GSAQLGSTRGRIVAGVELRFMQRCSDSESWKLSRWWNRSGWIDEQNRVRRNTTHVAIMHDRQVKRGMRRVTVVGRELRGVHGFDPKIGINRQQHPGKIVAGG